MLDKGVASVVFVGLFCIHFSWRARPLLKLFAVTRRMDVLPDIGGDHRLLVDGRFHESTTECCYAFLSTNSCQTY